MDMIKICYHFFCFEALFQLLKNDNDTNTVASICSANEERIYNLVKYKLGCLLMFEPLQR